MFLFFAGASITACRATGRHIVALEADKKIFASILQPMKDAVRPIATTVATEEPSILASQDPDAMAVKVRKFVQRDRTCK